MESAAATRSAAEEPAAARVVPDGEDPATPTAELVVRVRDRAARPLAGVGVRIEREGGEDVGGGVTDAAGELRVHGLRRGSHGVYTPMGDTSVRIAEPRLYEAAIDAAEIRSIRGRVVSDAAVGVAAAIVLLGADDSGHGMQPAATTDAAGRFEVRIAKSGCVLGARVEGRVDGPLEPAQDDVELHLGEPDSSCRIRTVGVGGEPVACIVLVGRPDPIRLLNPARQAMERWPAGREFETGPAGDVEVRGLHGYTRELHVAPRSADYAAWAGIWQGGPSQTIQLERSCSIVGTVYDRAGEPVATARVAIGSRRSWRRQQTLTDENGRFTLRGGPLGEQQVTASRKGAGRADAMLACSAGGRLTATLVLGGEHSVRLTDDAAQPRRTVPVRLSWRTHSSLACTDANGEVSVPDSWWRELQVEVLTDSGEWAATTVIASSDRQITLRQAER
ncbi:MAG: carboxypeptidase regulatory-like domain-containing protein [Planctomycetes bacterium]|nr:carboxypeptidase regulatory-like domain-containing protein [Planctomycetota bacterium]